MNSVELAKVISEGVASEEEKGIALRNLQTQLGVVLVNNLQNITSSFERLAALTQQAVDSFERKVQPYLDSDALNYDALFKMISEMQKNQISLIDLQRKIVQSPNRVFPDDTISSEEKKLLTLLKSFTSQEEKERFIKVVTETMMNNGH